MQARASYKGSSLVNEAASFIAEYSQRKRLAKLGYVSNISELSAIKAEIFGIIDVELDKCQNEDMRSKHGRK
jgi:hypothetical protein